MTNSSRQILNAVAEQAARLKARLADTHAAIRRGREDAAGADGDLPATTERDDAETGRSNVLSFVRR